MYAKFDSTTSNHLAVYSRQTNFAIINKDIETLNKIL